MEDEKNIVQGIKAGRESSYAFLFKSYYKLLSVFACNYVNDLEVAKELVQDLFVHLYEHRESLMISTSLRSYLFQAVRNRCLNHLKHEKLHQNHLEHLDRGSGDQDDPETLFMETELEYRVFQIISQLPPRCREIFRMSRVDGKGNAEIAKLLGISIRTVETQVSKAIKTLKKNLPE